jgi:hypothetical protein
MNEQISDNVILSNIDKLELYSDDYPFSISLKINSFENEKELFKFTKSCEKLIRSCPEYKEWRDYLINVLKNNYCLITHEINDEVSIDIHHHPISLFSITKTIINKKLDMGESFSSFDISSDIMKIHFSNQLGYIPLVKTIHEKFHSGFFKIPIGLIKGNYRSFIEEYGNYIDDSDMEIINERMAVTFSNIKWEKDSYPGLNQIDNIYEKVGMA